MMAPTEKVSLLYEEEYLVQIISQIRRICGQLLMTGLMAISADP